MSLPDESGLSDFNRGCQCQSCQCQSCQCQPSPVPAPASASLASAHRDTGRCGTRDGAGHGTGQDTGQDGTRDKTGHGTPPSEGGKAGFIRANARRAPAFIVLLVGACLPSYAAHLGWYLGLGSPFDLWALTRDFWLFAFPAAFGTLYAALSAVAVFAFLSRRRPGAAARDIQTRTVEKPQ